MDRTQQPSLPIDIASPGRRRPLVWLLLPVLALGLALLFLRLNRGLALLATLLLIVSLWGPALWRSRRLLTGLQALAQRREVRLLAFVVLVFGMAQVFLRLHLFFSRLLFLALLGGLLLVLARHERVQPLLIGLWRKVSALQSTRLMRWISFIALTALIVQWLTRLPLPYAPLVMGVLILGTLPLIYVRLRGGDAQAMLARGTGLMALLLALVAAHALENLEPSNYAAFLRIVTLGAGALLISVHYQRRSGLLEALPVPSTAALTPARLNLLDKTVFGLGLLLWLLFIEANGRLFHLQFFAEMHVQAQFGLMLLGLALMVTGYAGLLRWPLLRRPRIDRWTLLLVVLVTLLAFALRFHDLEFGLRQFVDEVNFASVVDGFWRRPYVPLTEAMSGIAAFPYLYPYWEAMTVDLFGHNMLGLRATSAILGALTIPAVYLLGQAAFDRKTGLLAALLLATFPPHLHFSRLALNNIADPLFGTLALAFLMRGLLRQRRLDYVLGGVMLGMTNYFYEGGRLIYTPLMVAWLIGLAYLWSPRLHWRRLVPVAAMLLLTALPVYYTLVVDQSSLVARLERNSQALGGDYWDRVVDSPDGLARYLDYQVLRPVRLMLRDVEGSYFYRGEDGLVLPLLVPLVFLGLGLAVLRLRSPGPLLLLGWWLIAILGNSVMVAPDHSPRYVVVFPALMLLAAVGLRYLWPLLTPRRGRWLIFGLLVLGLAAYQGNYYFNQYLPVYKTQLDAYKGHLDGTDAIFRAINFPPKTVVHIISEPPEDQLYLGAALHFLRGDLHLETLTPDELRLGYLAAMQPGVDHAIFIEPGHDLLLELIGRYYYLLPPQYSPYPDVPEYAQFTLYYAPYLGDYSDAKRAPLGLPDVSP